MPGRSCLAFASVRAANPHAEAPSLHARFPLTGDSRLAEDLGCSAEAARGIRAEFLDNLPEVAAWLQRCRDECQQQGAPCPCTLLCS